MQWGFLQLQVWVSWLVKYMSFTFCRKGCKMSETQKMTSICFGWMREWHYPNVLFREEELDPSKGKTCLFIKKDEYPALWSHMETIEKMDLQIKGVKCILLRLVGDSVEDSFTIEYYSELDKRSKKTAGCIQIFELSSAEVVDLVKAKIAEAMK